MKTKSIYFIKILTIIALSCIIFLLFSTYRGLNELKSIEMEQLRFTNEIADTNAVMACRELNDSDKGYYECLNDYNNN